MESFKQKLLRKLYPLVLKMGKKGKNGIVLSNDKNIAPQVSFYQLKATLNNGKQLDFSNYSGKKILIVNTASDCGYTAQYAELQKLQEMFTDKVVVIGFPANDFAGQEKNNDNQISEFCQINYGVRFPIAKKGVVIKTIEQQQVYRWLTNSNENGWNNHEPDWNFSKYLIDEEGNLINYFGPSISPMDPELLKAVK